MLWEYVFLPPASMCSEDFACLYLSLSSISEPPKHPVGLAFYVASPSSCPASFIYPSHTRAHFQHTPLASFQESAIVGPSVKERPSSRGDCFFLLLSWDQQQKHSLPLFSSFFFPGFHPLPQGGQQPQLFYCPSEQAQGCLQMVVRSLEIIRWVIYGRSKQSNFVPLTEALEAL